MFEKVFQEIKDTYIKENKINYKKGKFDLSEITHDINGLMYMFLSSYYFENLNEFKFVKSKTESNEDYYYIIGSENKFSKESITIDLNDEEIDLAKLYLKNKNELKIFSPFRNESLKRSIESGRFFLEREEIIEIFGEIPLKAYQNKLDAFKWEFDSYNDYPNKRFLIDCPYIDSPTVTEVLTNDKINKTINKLKENELYNLIFTNEDISKIINLKKKKDIEISISTIYKDINDISNYLKFSDKYEIRSDLKSFYGLRYFPSNKDDNFKALIAHNSYEIAGIASLVPPCETNIRKDSCVYLSYVEVCQSFYGHRLGLQLASTAIDYAKDNKLVLFRTSASKEGEKYIKDKITQLGIEKGVPVVSEPERNLITKLLSLVKEKSNEDIFNLTNKVLDYARNNYTEKQLSSNIHNQDIIDNFIKIKKGLKNGL